MKKLAAVLSVAALALAACTDVGPTALGPDAALFNGNAVFDLDPPSVSATVNGSDVTIDFSWSDGSSWEHVSFKLLRDGVEIASNPEIPNQKPYEGGVVLVRSYTDEGLDPGEYTYCVEVMARNEPGSPTHHNPEDSACETVTVGGAHTIEIVGGSAANGTFNKNAANFSLEFYLKLGAQIVSCADAPAAAVVFWTDPASSQQAHNCNAVSGLRTAVRNNPAVGTATSFTATWEHPAGTVIHTFDFASQ